MKFELGFVFFAARAIIAHAYRKLIVSFLSKVANICENLSFWSYLMRGLALGNFPYLSLPKIAFLACANIIFFRKKKKHFLKIKIF